MISSATALPRIEGLLDLQRAADDTLRLVTPPPRGFEAALAGRSALEAVYLTQQIGADSSVSHALAAVMAWERAAHIVPARNGLLLRDLLHSLSLMHAHLRNFYLQTLPDYLPWAELANYRGSWPELASIGRAVAARSASSWWRQSLPHPFSAAQRERLAENQLRALQALESLQRMMALVGGKYPMVMSIVPGGCSMPLTDAALLELRQILEGLAPLLEGDALQDALLVVSLHPRTRSAGKGGAGQLGPALLSVGTLGEATGALLPLLAAGAALGDKLEPLAPMVTESIATSFYRLPSTPAPRGQLLEPAPGKPRAYSWIKAPRYRGRPVEVGAVARLAITQMAAARGADAALMEQIERALGAPLQAGGTVAARLVARQAEVRMLSQRCRALLEQIDPAQPAVSGEGDALGASGEGVGLIEAPAGALRHRLVLHRGRIVEADIIAPSTWNGSSRDEKDQPGPLEAALSAAQLDPAQREDRLAASRIVQSFFFSATDAVQ